MSKVKSQTFARGHYKIEWVDAPLAGMCEIPDPSPNLYMVLPSGNTCKDMATCLHEVAHAEGVPDRWLDGGRDVTEAQARLLWRDGWRKV